jgi:hypothetical protein
VVFEDDDYRLTGIVCLVGLSLIYELKKLESDRTKVAEFFGKSRAIIVHAKFKISFRGIPFLEQFSFA